MSMSTVNQPEQFLRLPQVKSLLGFSATSTIYRLMATGELPAPVKIGRRAVAWKAADIAAWQASRPVARIAAVDTQQPSPTQ